MEFLWNKITEWLKDILVSGIMGNLNGLFDGINGQVSGIAQTVGTSPQEWNASIFNMIRNISETVIVPIAGIILSFITLPTAFFIPDLPPKARRRGRASRSSLRRG